MSRTRLWGPLAMSGLGLLAVLVAAALLWDEQPAIAWAALVVGGLEGILTAQDVALRLRGERLPNRWVGAPPVALGVGLLFLLVAILG